LNDLKLALRQLLKNPGFTAAAVLTLALGIGANSVVFSVAKAVLLRPIAFEGADRLMWIRLVNTATGRVGEEVSWREMEDIRESTSSFEVIATFGSPGAIWEQGDRAEHVPTLQVTPNLAEALRVRPALGRLLRQSDTTPGAEPVVMIGHEAWQSRFGGRPDVVGQTVRLDQKPRVIVGVLPPGLEFPLGRAPTLGTGSHLKAGVRSFWLPLEDPQGADRDSREHRMFLPVARLKPGVSEEAARAELASLAQRLAKDHPGTNLRQTFDIVAFRDQILGRTRQAIPILAVAVGAVLLICCVNLANLLLARGLARQREFAVKLALGAGRMGLIRSLLAESVLLALLGGALGVCLAAGALRVIRLLAASSVPFIGGAVVDPAVVAFTTGLSLAAALAFGWLPAARLTRVEASETLRAGARATASRRVQMWQRGLLVGQIAAVMALLASAGLLLESFRRLLGQDLGYQPRSVVAIDIITWGMETNEEVCRLYRALHARLSALPGVEAVGSSSSAPLTGKWNITEKAQVVGESLPEADRPALAATFVAFDYFQAMGIPLLEGRLFRDSELNDSGYGQNVVVNQSAASLLFPGRPALGGRFTVGSNPSRPLEIIGVVKDTRDDRLEEKPAPRLYWQYSFGGAQLVVRSAAPASVMIPLLRDVALQTDGRIIPQEFRPMSEIVSGTVAERRFLMVMLASYALVALAIAAVGIFGVVGRQVAQRTGEFGVRLALGSSPGGLQLLVLRQAASVTLLGIAMGLALTLAASRLIASQLHGVTPQDPSALGAASLAMAAAALLASCIPARKAAQVNPMEALRHE